jgi:zinc protease
MDRKVAPSLQEIKNIDFVRPDTYHLNNFVKLYHMPKVANETARVDLYFDAGTIKGDKGISSFVNELLLSGNEKMTANQINHQVDLWGGFFESGITSEGAVVSVYSLRENMLPLLEFLRTVIQEMTCQEKEVLELVQDKKQKFLVNLQKTRYLAQREFQRHIFASNEQYSKIVMEDYYEDVQREKLLDFFKTNYLKGLTKMAVVGNFNASTIEQIVQLFRPWALEKDLSFVEDMANNAINFHLNKEDAMQSAVRVGRILFNKKHEDYHDFNILNTILGDYFGSRLMNNIREDKGYTYGIGSMIAEYNNFGYFMIGTEVGKEVKDATLDEIQREFNRLKNELVGDEELGLVKNYLLGQLLKSADGPYSMMDLFLSAEVHNKDLDFYNQSIQSIRNIQASRLRDLANQYLKWDEMTIVSAG